MTGQDRNPDRNRQGGKRPPGGVSVSIRSVQPVLMFLRARGYDGAALLREQGVDPEIFRDPEARLLHVAAVRLWEAAVQHTNDPNLGLHVAEAIRPGTFGALDYALRTSASLGAAFTRLSRYHRLLHDAARVELETHRDHAILSHRLPVPGGAPRPVSEFILAGWLVTSRQATGVDWVPIRACFPHRAPADTSEHHRVFGCPLKFGHSCSELVLSRKLLDLPLLKADPILQGIVETQVVALLAKLPKAEATTDAVRRLLAEELANGPPTLEQIAPRLRMSARTLHRRLDEEGTSFRRVLAEVRRELAARHLREPQLAVGEIAFLLGSPRLVPFTGPSNAGPVTHRAPIGTWNAVCPKKQGRIVDGWAAWSKLNR